MMGDCSAGFITTVLPATRAAAVIPVRIASGKFQGAMTTATPRGREKLPFRFAGPAARPRARQGPHPPGVVVAETDRFGDVGVGLAPRLAPLVALPPRHLKPPLAHFGRRQLDVLGPELRLGARPFPM